METLWFWLVAVMVAIYVVMDGFDFGAGIHHLTAAKTNEERRTILAAIGPLWDGNEVWLLAGGGAMFLAFPRVLAAGFSGFYLAFFMVVWTLILRGISIEFRSHVRDSLWQAFWDGTFGLASTLLPILFGAALGNVIRGVPLDGTGAFNLPLFTHFGTSNPVGILDWYTVFVGIFALVTLALHGALFLAWKTEGPVHDRVARRALPLWVAVVVLWILATVATHAVNPRLFAGLAKAPLAWFFSGVYLIGLLIAFLGIRRKRWLLAFLGSSAFILGILAATAASVFPVMLASTLDPAFSLTAHNSAVSASGLRAGLGWWLLGFPLAVGYFSLLFRIHRGKAQAAPEGEGY